VADGDGDGKSLRGKGGLLFYRKPLCRPDRFFTWLEPKLWFLWTPAFVLLSFGLMAVALAVVVANRGELASAFPQAMRWETLAVVWVALVLATCLHECAHGLTCKHFGGEAPDAGVMLMLLMPCFYCNVSDAWLIPQKSRRLWITAAGAYCDLCVWAASVFVWRVTVPDSLVNYVVFVVMGVCGTRSLLNLNPFLRLDGYYLLSDWLAIPNLRTRAGDHWMAHVRWLLWGVERPRPAPRGGVLVVYGIFVWIVAVAFRDFIVFQIAGLVSGGSVVFGWLIAAVLIFVAGKRVFRGFFATEFAAMLKRRRGRTLVWLALLIGLPALVFLIPMNRKATGEFAVHPQKRVEVHAEVWRLHAIAELERARLTAQQEILRLELEIQQHKTELEFTRESLARSKKLYELGALAGGAVPGRDEADRPVGGAVEAGRFAPADAGDARHTAGRGGADAPRAAARRRQGRAANPGSWQPAGGDPGGRGPARPAA
jgi:hypothetical protein